jgi:hypothetical protein
MGFCDPASEAQKRSKPGGDSQRGQDAGHAEQQPRLWAEAIQHDAVLRGGPGALSYALILTRRVRRCSTRPKGQITNGSLAV